MRHDTTNQITIDVVDVRGYTEPSINVRIDYGGNVDLARLYSFAGWRHFLGHMGDLLPLTDCVITVQHITR